MSAADLLEDSWPHTHGTPDGYDAGCKSAACPAGIEYGLSCRTAKRLSRSDFRYGRMVRDGASVAAIADAFGLIGTNTPPAPTKTKKRTATAPAPADDPTPADKPRTAPTPATTKGARRIADGAPTQLATDPSLSVPTPTDTPTEDGAPTDEPTDPNPADIRTWARERGYTVATRGAIPKNIVEHYWETHGLLDPVHPDDQPPINKAQPAPPQEAAPDQPAPETPTVNETGPRPDYGTMNLEQDLNDATERIRDLTTELAAAQTERDATTEERDAARNTAARLWDELTRSEEQREADRAKHAHTVNLLTRDVHRSAQIAADDSRTITELHTALAAASAALHTTERALELVLHKWDEATKREALDGENGEGR